MSPPSDLRAYHIEGDNAPWNALVIATSISEAIGCWRKWICREGQPEHEADRTDPDLIRELDYPDVFVAGTVVLRTTP